MKVNLISDTVTKPTPGMLDAMMNASVGDDVFKQDPTVNELEAKVARMFGKEAALFFPSGTMANQTAIKLHTQPGDQMICDRFAHVYNYEGGGAAANSGVTSYLIPGERGMFKPAQILAAINDKDNIHLPKSRLIAIENTTNKGGGACWEMDDLIQIEKMARAHDLSYHLDGARLFNALVAQNQSPKQFGALFDTISICLSKGLGAPVGSVLIGSEEDMKTALRIRKLFGGGMRQAGYLAAAGIYALDHHVDRLAEDHTRAQRLAEALKACKLVKKVEPCQTNIVIFEFVDSKSEQSFMEYMSSKEIQLISMGGGKLRLVTHLDFTDEMLDYVLDQIQALNSL